MTNDFIAYWAAARLLLNDGNAYSPAQVLELQRTVDSTMDLPTLMYNPPWTLPLVLPFGWLDHDTAQMGWFLLHTVIIFLGTRFLWQHYAGNSTLSRVGWLALLAFAPIYFVLLIGQIGPVVLASVIGFLLAVCRQSWFRAGAWLAIGSIKPHLLYLLWIAVLLWLWRHRKWRVAAGFAVVFAVLAAVPLFLDGQIYARYLNLMSDRAVILPMDWLNPTIGMAVNELSGSNTMWLRWLPAVGGALWLACCWQKNTGRWDWSKELPLILLVSIVTTPYSWTFDYVVLLPALIQGVVWLSALTLCPRKLWVSAIYLASCAILLFGKFFVLNDFWYFWLAPTLLVLYLWLRTAESGTGAQA
jgi:hypothetical protein